ncbi:MAG: hypothetical protein J07HX5_01614 [halophilic archaeon J07HX5]|jgi:hypothetical protein|nr:MAG: hypothetical protein J07HX5_01614 [halophilic archaeon J07HX5]
MLTIDLEEFTFELADGAIKHVGASTTNASVTLYDVQTIERQPFGDDRVKLVFADDEGNKLAVSLAATQLDRIRAIASEESDAGDT